MPHLVSSNSLPSLCQYKFMKARNTRPIGVDFFEQSSEVKRDKFSNLIFFYLIRLVNKATSTYIQFTN